MSFLRLEDITEIEPVPGYRGRFVHSDNMTLAYWDVAEGAVAPEHSHPHEQIVSVIEGSFELRVGGHPEIMQPGGIAVIPPNVSHSGRAVTHCRIIDTFHPAREDFRAMGA